MLRGRESSSLRRRFFELFPPPRLLLMNAVGVHLDATAIRYFELSWRRGLPNPRCFGTIPLPPDALAGGAVAKKEALVGALQTLRREVKSDFLVAALPEEKAYLFTLALPAAAAGNLRAALEFRLEEHVPLPAREAVFDFSPLAGDPRLHAAHADLAVTVMPHNVVSDFLQSFSLAGFFPLSFEVESQACARSLIPNNFLGTALIIHFGETRTGFSVVTRGSVSFASVSTIGCSAITDALAEHFSVPREEAKQIRESRGYASSGRNMEILFSLTNIFSAIKDEANKVLTYWQTHQREGGESHAVQRIVLTGRGGAFFSLDEYLSRTLKIPVEVGNVWTNLAHFDDYIPPIEHLDSLDYAGAIGAAMGAPAYHHG